MARGADSLPVAGGVVPALSDWNDMVHGRGYERAGQAVQLAYTAVTAQDVPPHRCGEAPAFTGP